MTDRITNEDEDVVVERGVRIGVDVGGTFTDLVCFSADEATGRIAVRTAKAGTTPPDFEKGVLDVLDKAAIDAADVDLLVHGTTIVINAITERRGVKVGLITTEGFRDILEIARGNRPDFFNLHYRKPPAFVPRHLRREIPERISWRGEVMRALDLSPLDAILDDFRREEVAAVAICLLHAYANPDHEAALETAVREAWPGVAVVASHRIAREWREYERTSSAVLSAYVQPVVERYLDRLKLALDTRGFAGGLYLMQSNGGVGALEAARRTPISMVESGPASGIQGAAELGRLIGEENVIALDIGGTTAKCALIEGSSVRIMTDYWIERDRTSAGYPVMVPVVDLVEIGSGGGSIARVDDFGKLHVGPRSAGASPGPAAYGRAGGHATTTDANLLLGRINPSFFCGGAVAADMEAVRSAIGSLASRLAMTIEEAARGIVRIANNDMVNALKLVSVNRGFDPRDFTLVAFGGGGGLHASALARELGVRKVVVPHHAAVFSAWGMMMSDLRRDHVVTHLADLHGREAAAIEDLLAATERAAGEDFIQDGVEAGRVATSRFGRFRYRNQEHTIEIPLGPEPVTRERVAAIAMAFHEAYEREYTYRMDAPVEMVGIHVVATVGIGRIPVAPRPARPSPADAARKETRRVDFAPDGVHDAAILDGEMLEAGMRLAGPAVIESSGTTVVIHPGDTAGIDGYGNVVIRPGT